MSERIAAYKRDRDAYGHMLMDHLNGEETDEVIEREDGFISTSRGTELYFSEYPDWPDVEKDAMHYVNPGRVLDLGCGAGRMELYLQGKGYDVVGIDNSPLAVDVCRRRGVKDARLLSVTQVSQSLGCFDNILMMGNNWGLMGNKARAKWLMRKFYTMTSPGARVIAESNDIFKTESAHHLAYHAYNRERGRMAGQIRLRVLYKLYRSGWFDYLMVSKSEMMAILDGTGWRVRQFIDSESSLYVAVMEKEKNRP